jgi:hypothetical protein
MDWIESDPKNGAYMAISGAELFGLGEFGRFSTSSQISGVTMTWGANGGAPTEIGPSYGRTSPMISVLGGTPAAWGSAYPQYLVLTTRNTTLSTGARSGMGGRVAFETDGSSFDITRPALIDRIGPDGIDANGDIYVIAMGVNDDTGIYDEVVASITALTEAKPWAKIFVVNGWNYNAPNQTGKDAVYAEVEAALALFPQVVLLDPRGVSFRTTDGIHPDLSGNWILGEWLTAQIKYLSQSATAASKSWKLAMHFRS